LHFCCAEARGVDPPDEEAGGLQMIEEPLMTGGDELLGKLGFAEMLNSQLNVLKKIRQ